MSRNDPIWKQVVAGLLRFSILTAVFLGSCVGSGAAYIHSPKWELHEVDLDKHKTFFGAYSTDADEEVDVVLYKFLPESNETKKVFYRMPREEISIAWPSGGSATVTAQTQADGSQLVRIHAIGDTPWVSLSEYRVADNEIYPLRHGSANAFYLLGALLSPVVTMLARRPVRRLVGLIVATGKMPKEAKTEGSD